MKEFIEIPFGAKDSELGGWEYNIPEGYTANIENGKIIVKKEDSEDEKIRNKLIEAVTSIKKGESPWFVSDKETCDKVLAWLEKQGEKEKFIKKELGCIRDYREEAIRRLNELEKQGEQNKWKPSKDEMDALYGLAYMTNKMDDKKDEAITKLYQDLKREFFDGASYENMFPSSPVDALIKDEKQGEQKPAWSEEDEEMVECVIEVIDTQYAVSDYNEMVDWLKSLKERYTWKPSEEQMKALNDINVTGGISYAGQGQELITLYNDLKKLREK